MKLNKFMMAGLLAFTGFGANAMLTATAFTGAAMIPFTKQATKIGAAATATTAIMEMSTQNAVSAIHSSGMELTKAVMLSGSKSVTENATMSQIQVKLEMDYAGTLEANKQMQMSQLRKGETAAELKFVMDFLRRDDIKDLNISEAIDYAKEKLDGVAKVVDEPLLDKSGSCKGGKCGYERAITPSFTIEAYAVMCAEDARDKTELAGKTAAENRTNIDSAKESQDVLDGSSSGVAQAARLKEQLATECSAESVALNLCGDVTKEDYINKVLKNEIIPNGGVSAVNFYAPASVGGAGMIDLNDLALKKMVKLIEFDALEKTDGGKRDLPPIVQTYRNSAQLKAAVNYVNNIVNLDAVANQKASDRKLPTSVDFQTLFMSRAAQLDLVKNTLNATVADRRGQKLSGISMSSLKAGEIVKEVEDGASPIDMRWHRIQQDMEKVSPQNIGKLTEMTDNQIWLEIYRTLVKKNAAQFDRMIRLEGQSLLLGSLVSATTNSPENIEYLKNLGE